jgi:hypothetical protein
VTPHRVGLGYLPEPDALECVWDEDEVCAIRTDGHPLAPALARQLAVIGWRVVLLDSRGATGEADVPCLHLDTSSPTFCEDALQTIADRFGRLAAWIDIPHVSSGGPADPLSNDAEELRLLSTFAMATRLAPVLNVPRAGRAWFVVITHVDGKLGLADPPRDGGIITAGLLALPKSLRHEWPGVFCRAIDLHPDLDVETAARRIVAELGDPDCTLAEVGHGPDGRCTIVTLEAVDA